ncbi:nucleoside hydrolase [Paenibacillus tyrfis]|uniref:nucleoside hydrolase n=1 Tax=Paenibacillus tyrfis TaxID=1501230 RepID=UPI00209CFD4C|nr:nucleoside hydrolase [Paenibacillus tyrfis]MCP1312431.1 nucleoside hydrolase [Paenibacillus tyrfis]
MKQTVKMIMDVDTGIDDALAILFALKSGDVELLGVTTAAGNVTAEQATLNTRQVLELAGAHIEVFQGAAKPISRDWVGTASDIHGVNGIGEYVLPAPKVKDSAESALEYIIRKVNEFPNQIVLVFVGRLTNLALALQADPTMVSKIKKLVIMGGAVRVPGNVTPEAEANIYGDPEAADLVFRSGIPLAVVGLDVTMKALFKEAHLERLLEQAEAGQEELLSFTKHIIQYRFEAYMRKKGIKGTALHDPLAVAVAINPSLVVMEKTHVRIKTEETHLLGATIEEPQLSKVNPNAEVAIDVNTDAFIHMFIETLARKL